MADPRTESLAAALDAAICNHQHDASAPLHINHAHLQPVTYRSCAAAILAALDGYTLVPTDAALIYMDDYMAGYRQARSDDAATIAALPVVAHSCDGGINLPDDARWLDRDAVLAALRAALEAER